MTTEPVQRKLHFILEDHYGIKPRRPETMPGSAP
jgi:hypothetical protein